MVARTFIEAIRETLADEMRRDESVIVLGEDVGKKGGVFSATDGLWGEFGDDRVIDTPLTESMIVGTSIGAAVNGLRPVCEIQLGDFIFSPAFNQIVSEAARMRYRSNNGYGVPMVIRRHTAAGSTGPCTTRRASRPSSPTCRDSRSSCLDPVRRARPAARFDPRRRPGPVLRAQEDAPLGARRRARDRLRRAAGQGGRDPPRLARDGHRRRPDGALRAGGGRPGRRRRHQRRGRRRAHAPANCSTRRPCWSRCARRARAWSSTRTTSSAATARRSRRSSPKRRSTTSTVRSPGRRAEVPAALQPRPGGVVHGQPEKTADAIRTSRRTEDPLVPGPTDLAGLQTRLEAVLDPYRDRLEAFDSTGRRICAGRVPRPTTGRPG